MLCKLDCRSLLGALVLTALLGSYARASSPVPHKAGEYFSSFKAEPYMMIEDFAEEPIYDCTLQYYYYIPCPTYSWFWAYSGWEPGDVVGMVFTLADEPTGARCPCDPAICHHIEYIRVLEFAGYGASYPGLFTVEMDFYCCDKSGYPSCHLWNSGGVELHMGWNYIQAVPPVPLDPCKPEDHPWEWNPASIAVTMTMTGTEGEYPAVGFDNVSTSYHAGCVMHDIGCLPAVFPRTWAGGMGASVHSGYVGSYPFQYWPPLPLPDGSPFDPVNRLRFGFVEAAWRLYVLCTVVPTVPDADTQPTTWSAIKSIYR